MIYASSLPLAILLYDVTTAEAGSLESPILNALGPIVKFQDEVSKMITPSLMLSKNAYSPMDVTVEAMLMEVISIHVKNAQLPICVTPYSTITVWINELSVSQGALLL